MASDEEETKAKKLKLNQQQKPTNSMDSLPQEVALDIISRLPAKSLIQSRFACKSWHELSHDPDLVGLHLSRTLISEETYLVFHSDAPIKNHLYFVESPNDDQNQRNGEKVMIRKLDPPFSSSMPEFSIIGSCNGILCLENSMFEEALYLYNPFTQQHAKIPESAVFQDQVAIYGFGFHPGSNQYKVIKIVYYPSTPDVNKEIPNRRFARKPNLKTDVQVFTLGSERWRSIGPTPYQIPRRSLPVLLNGRMHWTTTFGFHHGRTNRLIVSFDVQDEVFREVPGPELTHRMSRQNYQISALGESLCVGVPLAASAGSLDLWIMKEYGNQDSWVKEVRVGVYSPTVTTHGLRKAFGIWRNALIGRVVRVVCRLRNGEILLEYKGGALASFHPETGVFRDVTFPGLPSPSKTVLLVGTLNRVDAPAMPRGIYT